jgi:hypothetical protein
MIRKLIVFALYFYSISAFTYTGLRYNLAGYHPDRPKTIIIISDKNCINYPWRIKEASGKVVLNGITGKSISGSGPHTPKIFNHEINFSALTSEGEYVIEVDNVDTIRIKISKNPYADYVHEVLRYLRQQRSGTDQCVDHKISHLGDKSCIIFRRNGTDNTSWSYDKSNKTVNMLGGWYDAGDYIKFTLTTAYTTYFLLRSYEENPEMFRKKIYSRSELNDMLDEAKWGLDYLMKCMPDTTEFIIQTGGYLDHEQGLRLPDKDILNGKRECYSALSPTHMGYTAAALALGAKIFSLEKKDAEAKQYREMAEKIYRIALRNDKEENNAWFEKDFQFYADNTKNDNLELASVELYLLTKNDYYLKKAIEFAQQAKSAYWAAWPNVNMIAHLRLLSFYPEAKDFAETDLKYFQSIAGEANNIWGVPHKYTWATLYSFFTVANASVIHSRMTGSKEFLNMTYNVTDYTFGKNNWGICMIALKNIPKSVRNIYSQVYKLQPELFPSGAIAEGPGDRQTHDNLMQYFQIPDNDPFHEFNTKEVVFFDNNTDFQSMETTITGLADGIFMLTLLSKNLK